MGGAGSSNLTCAPSAKRGVNARECRFDRARAGNLDIDWRRITTAVSPIQNVGQGLAGLFMFTCDETDAKTGCGRAHRWRLLNHHCLENHRGLVSLLGFLSALVVRSALACGAFVERAPLCLHPLWSKIRSAYNRRTLRLWIVA